MSHWDVPLGCTGSDERKGSKAAVPEEATRGSKETAWKRTGLPGDAASEPRRGERAALAPGRGSRRFKESEWELAFRFKRG